MNDLRGKHLHFDGASGIAGDMTLGAFVDLGVPIEALNEAVASVGLGDNRIIGTKIVKGGMSATDVTVRLNDGTTSADDYDDHAHRHHHYADIKRQLEDSDLKPSIKARALDIFSRIARAEATLHGTSLDDVAFHEVGAVDAICDVVGAAAGLDYLEPKSVSSSAVCVGQGSVNSAHGVLPVPSPAALDILREAKAIVRGGGVAKELCTPTGAAILAHAVTSWEGCPDMIPFAIGYGAGDRELEDRPNVLRCTLSVTPAEEGNVLLIEANVDDMTPEACAYTLQKLMESGALDAWWQPVVMKKGRPAWVLSALCTHVHEAAVSEVVFAETTTLGYRISQVDRRMLERRIIQVESEYGLVDIKVGSLAGHVKSVSPEYDSVSRIAKAKSLPFKEVHTAALQAYRTSHADPLRSGQD